MTLIAELLDRLTRLDIRLALDGDRLVVNAPKGALTAELREELRQRKEETKNYLKAQNGMAGMTVPREEAPVLQRVARGTEMPISHTQQRLWFIKQMDPGTYVYNVPAAIRLKGTLDIAALERTLADLVNRHESLRTCFLSVDGTPRCAIETQARLALERIDVSHLPESEQEEAALREVQAVAQRPFDLTRAPLLHTTLVRLANDRHIFAFVLDHIIADGLSLGVFLVEFQALYTQHVTGVGQPLPELPVQYLDYTEWERRWFAKGVLEEHRTFWRQQLAGLPALLHLPTDRPRSPVQTTRGARLVAQLPGELGSRLKALARHENATLFIVLLAAFQVLLHRYSGETDIAVGSVIANRSRSEVERVIGFFANNIVLRGDLSGNPTVGELIARVRDVALKTYAHQAMPFDMLVDTLVKQRELDHSPLFQVMFVLQSQILLTRLDLPALACEMMELPCTTARFDLAVDVFDLADGLRVYFEYNTDLFDATTIEHMLGHYQRLLDGFVIRLDARIDELPMLADDERNRLLLDWNRTAIAYPSTQTVHSLFEAQVTHTPDAVALSFEDLQLIYRDLNARANQLARHLRSLGVGRESLVGVWMERSTEMIVALLGILKAGGAYVPLDPAFPKDRIDYMIEDAALSVIVTQEKLAASLAPHLHALCIDRDAVALAQWPSENLPAASGPDNLAYVIYTSGSTGRPKGVQLEHRSVVNFLCSMHREPGIGACDRFVSVTTLSFDIAGLEIHGPLTCGGTVVLANRATALDGQRLAALLDNSEATLLQATPATWRLLLESGWQGRAGLKMLCGGEGLPRDLADKLLALGGELWNMYGPTETTIWSTLWRITDTQRVISIGRPIANTQVYVLEPSGLPAPISVGGELCIGGDGLARGYRNRDDLTAEKFVMLDLPGVGTTRVYRTGDVARFLADGRLEFVGRRDHQVKVRGFRIELGEIETVLATHPGLKESVVHVREDTLGDQRLVGYVVPAEAAPFDADVARATLRAKLPEYMIPNLFVVLDALPLTPNGKVDRKALPVPQVQAASAADQASEALMTPIQRQVADLWCEVLKIDRVGLHANFFDMGGHSLLLVKLQSALQREFGLELPLVELFQRTTVAAQAERLAAPATSNAALERAQDRAIKQTWG